MKNYSEANKFVKEGIKPHQILFAWTSEQDYEMERKILLEYVDNMGCDDYLLLEGFHCSCYDFDDTEWEGTTYSGNELKKLANADYNKNDPFWKMVRNYI